MKSDQTSDEVIELTATAGAGQRLDRFLASQLQQVSRTRIQRWIALGAVNCEQRALAAKTRLQGHERLLIEPQPLEADAAFVAEDLPVSVVVRRKAMLVVNKPVGLVVHPGAGNWQGTLMNGLLFHFPELAALPRAGIVHRLDKDTSGLLAIARTESARENLIGQLADRSLSRQYLAICEATVEAPVELEGPIGRDPSNRLRMAVVATGKPAHTRVEPLAFGVCQGKPVTLLRCLLRTGRTHQIRVHLSHAGMPLLGDAVYGGSTEIADRQMLHAWRLALARPVDGESGAFEAPPPADFIKVMADCGLHYPIETADEV
ncbi:MAG: RluA family pseudouridine synthase [Burkholderiaceae bacterium]